MCIMSVIISKVFIVVYLMRTENDFGVCVFVFVYNDGFTCVAAATVLYGSSYLFL